MVLRIKKVKQCKNKAFGNYTLTGKNSALITVSLKKNKLVAEYGATLLHELLHMWTTLLRKEGVKVTNKVEHEFIYDTEENIYKIMKKHFKKDK